MNPFLRYLADKNSAHTHTHTQTDRHTPLTTRPDGLRRAGNYAAFNHGNIVSTDSISSSTNTVNVNTFFEL